MKLLIAGSRSIREFDLSNYVPPDTDLIITGGAKGIDMIAETYADTHKISKLILRPLYRKYKRGAPIKRNEMMVDLADQVLIVWDGISNGTRYTIEYAQQKGKPLLIIENK